MPKDEIIVNGDPVVDVLASVEAAIAARSANPGHALKERDAAAEGIAA